MFFFSVFTHHTDSLFWYSQMYKKRWFFVQNFNYEWEFGLTVWLCGMEVVIYANLLLV
jgi:hypothetical protein